jgi:hypothetical protein
MEGTLLLDLLSGAVPSPHMGLERKSARTLVAKPMLVLVWVTGLACQLEGVMEGHGESSLENGLVADEMNRLLRDETGRSLSSYVWAVSI